MVITFNPIEAPGMGWMIIVEIHLKFIFFKVSNEPRRTELKKNKNKISSLLCKDPLYMYIYI